MVINLNNDFNGTFNLAVVYAKTNAMSVQEIVEIKVINKLFNAA